MLLKQKHKILFFSLMIILSFMMLAQVALAAGVADTISGLKTTAKEGYGDKYADNSDLSTVIGKVVGSILAFLGVAFFVLMIYGGFTWMFSMGNEQTAGKAKDIIIAAVIGLVIVLLAYVITNFVGVTLLP